MPTHGGTPTRHRPAEIGHDQELRPARRAEQRPPRVEEHRRGGHAALNHLGVEVRSADEVGAATTRLAEAGLATAAEENATCCYAVQDKVWVNDPDGAPWDVYTVLADAPAEVVTPGRVGDYACCGGTMADSTSEQPAAAACC